MGESAGRNGHHMEPLGKQPARGLLLVLANVAPENEAEFNRWYDREHMRERVAIPGFVSAQRYRAVGTADWKYLALYHTEGLSTFTSPVYREALANQSPWSKQILARFRDPQRAVAERTCRAGYGVGGAVRLGRVRPKYSRDAALREVLASKVLPALATREGVCEASLFQSDPALSKPVPEYPKSSITKVRPDDWFLLVHTSDPAAVTFPLAPRARDLADTFEWIGTYSLLWYLHRSDL